MNYSSGQESGMYKSVSQLGKVIGAGLALFALPAFYNQTQGPLLKYFSGPFGSSAGYWMAWAMILTLTAALYRVAELAFTGLVTWWIAKRAATGFEG
jgi:hypothetical protein